jgi:lipoprotein-releasing system permease protein
MKGFYHYFLNYIIRAKTRQKLLFVAVLGLFISAFSLMALQGIMGGLQKGLISRSKKVLGHGEIRFSAENQNLALEIINLLSENKIRFYQMLEVEMLIGHDKRLAPITLKGFNPRNPPPFLRKKDLQNVVIGADIATKIGAFYQSMITFVTPQYSDSLMGDLPRSASELISDFYASDLAEIDGTSAWVRLNFIKNLIRKDMINRLSFYDEDDFIKARKLLKDYNLNIMSWEDKNQSLVFALNLETSVMLFLFASMSFLLAISITSGFLIFYSKIHKDLLSFWILGKSVKDIKTLTKRFSIGLSFFSSFIGALVGLLFLYIIDAFGVNFLPDFFVETKIPVSFNMIDFFISFLIPFGIAVIFTKFSLVQFSENDQSFVSTIRSVGN